MFVYLALLIFVLILELMKSSRKITSPILSNLHSRHPPWSLVLRRRLIRVSWRCSSPCYVLANFSILQVMQARLFAYPDAARYRLGVNYQQLPTNAAKSQVYCPFQRDGFMNFSDNYGADPNYVGSSLQPTPFYQNVKGTNPQALSTLTEHEKWVGEVTSFQSQITDDDFEQPAALWKVIGKEPGHQQRFFGNIAGHLGKVKSARLRRAVYGMFPNRFRSGQAVADISDKITFRALLPTLALVSEKLVRLWLRLRLN